LFTLIVVAVAVKVVTSLPTCQLRHRVTSSSWWRRQTAAAAASVMHALVKFGCEPTR